MKIRKIKQEDDIAIASIIRKVMTEFGATGEGYSIHDKEVDQMYESYNKANSAYFVLEDNGKIFGGAGIGPLEGGEPEVCELKKMYFLPEGRGKGMGKEIIKACIAAAQSLGYKTCYLETVARMEAANRLYKSQGFRMIDGSLGNTGHHGCQSFYVMEL